MDPLERVIRRLRLRRTLLGHGNAGHPEREYASESNGKKGSHKGKSPVTSGTLFVRVLLLG